MGAYDVAPAKFVETRVDLLLATSLVDVFGARAVLQNTRLRAYVVVLYVVVLLWRLRRRLHRLQPYCTPIAMSANGITISFATAVHLAAVVQRVANYQRAARVWCQHAATPAARGWHSDGGGGGGGGGARITQRP